MGGLNRRTLLLAGLPVAAGASTPDPRSRVRALSLPLTAEDAALLAFDGELPVHLHLPAGDGPFPLALIHHERRYFTSDYPLYAEPVRYFLARGYAVALPLRIGYGELNAAGDRESTNCYRPDPARIFVNSTRQSALVLEGLTAQRQPVDRLRVLHVGVGLGGFAALSAAALSPFGVLGVINFGGGAGGYPERYPGEPCASEALARYAARLGRIYAQLPQRLPSLWVYAQNDKHFGPRHVRHWHAQFRRGGGTTDFHLLPAWGDDGNRLFADGIEVWRPLVDRYLNALAAP